MDILKGHRLWWEVESIFQHWLCLCVLMVSWAWPSPDLLAVVKFLEFSFIGSESAPWPTGKSLCL